MGAAVTMEGKLLFPSEYLSAVDLQGKDVTVEIEKVNISELQMVGGQKKKKPLIFFKGKQKKLVLNKTNAVTIASIHGNAVEDWIGKSITLYPTKTRFGPEEVDCLRVRKAT